MNAEIIGSLAPSHSALAAFGFNKLRQAQRLCKLKTSIRAWQLNLDRYSAKAGVVKTNQKDSP